MGAGRGGSNGGGSLVGQGQVDDMRELVPAVRLDALTQQQCLDLGVLVQLADLGDYSQADRDARLAPRPVPACDRV